MSIDTQQKPKAIIFDLLTALLDSWSVWNIAAGSPTLGHAWRSRYLELTYSCGAYRPYEDLVSESAADTPDLPSTAAADLVSHWVTLTPWPEVPPVLRQLRASGYKSGIITNCSTALGHRAAQRCAELCGIEFDAVTTAEEAGFYKPHPTAYGKVLEALGIEPSDALFVAGSAADVPGASAAGMRVVWHNRIGLGKKDGAVEPDKEGRTLDELLKGVVL